MASTIVASSTSGLVQTADNSGVLQLASGTGNLVTIPSVTGTAMVSGNMPAFSAYTNSTTTLTANTDIKVTFGAEVFDTANCFASSRFTPNVAGYYLVNVCLSVNYWNGIIFSAAVFKNGSAYQYGQTAYPQTTGGVRASISTLVYLNGTTDYIEGYGYQYAQTTNNVVAATENSYFNACLVRAA